MQIQPYLYFDGRCEEALEFYRTALRAEILTLSRFKDAPEAPSRLPPGNENKIMHASFRVGESTMLASDGMCVGKPNFQGMSLSLQAANDLDAEKLFAALASGGQVQMPIAKSFFSSRFGMVADRFGISWMVSVAP